MFDEKTDQLVGSCHHLAICLTVGDPRRGAMSVVCGTRRSSSLLIHGYRDITDLRSVTSVLEDVPDVKTHIVYVPAFRSNTS